jgi:hypothetical protein
MEEDSPFLFGRILLVIFGEVQPLLMKGLWGHVKGMRGAEGGGVSHLHTLKGVVSMKFGRDDRDRGCIVLQLKL